MEVRVCRLSYGRARAVRCAVCGVLGAVACCGVRFRVRGAVAVGRLTSHRVNATRELAAARIHRSIVLVDARAHAALRVNGRPDESSSEVAHWTNIRSVPPPPSHG